MIPGQPKTNRCDRPYAHAEHRWVPHPQSRLEFTCDGHAVEAAEVLFDLAVAVVLTAIRDELQRTLLAVLAEHGPRSHGQLALLSGYSPKASTIGVSLGKLRKAGFVADGQPITATQEGVDWLGDYEPLPTGQALIDYWRNKFGLTEQRVLDAVLSCYPASTSQAEVAEITGYSPTASTIGGALGRLRKVGVIDGWRISDDFAAGAGLA